MRPIDVGDAMAGPTTDASLTTFAAAHQLELVRFAYLLCPDRQVAEDLVQDVLTAMYRRFGDGLPDRNPLAYARTALVHAHISRRCRRWTSEATFGLQPVDVPAEPAVDPDERDRVWAGLQVLPERQRAARAASIAAGARRPRGRHRRPHGPRSW